MAKKKDKKMPTSSKSKSEKKNAKVAYDEEDDEELLLQENEAAISASEDEGGSDDERKHRKLLEAISSLDGKKRRKLAERSEASLQMSEFTVSAEGAGEKISLTDLMGTLPEGQTSINRTKKQLKNLQNRRETLKLPLSRQQTEKIQRTVAFDKAAAQVAKWQSVVEQNQKAEQLIFPLNQEPSRPKRVEEVVSGWKAQTPLEQEIFSLLSKNKQPTNDPILTPMEEACFNAMSLEEAKLRRAELQKARALQSYYEAKARRERKIKSKMYHKVLKKGKQKEFLTQFEEMRKNNPAAALEELNKLELGRVTERMSLKHQNSGKWAKSKAIMAKYDLEARKAMQEQLELNKQLTQKLAKAVESEDETASLDGDEEAQTLPDFVNEAQPAADPANPWMRGKLSEEPTEPEKSGESKAKAEDQQLQEVTLEDTEDEEEEDQEEVLLKEFEAKRKLRNTESLVPKFALEKEDEKKEAIGGRNSDEEEEEEVSEFNSLFQKVVGNGQVVLGEKRTGVIPSSQQAEEPALIEESTIRIQTLEDMEHLDLSTGDSNTTLINTDAAEKEPDQSMSQPAEKNKKKKNLINCHDVLTKETHVIKVPLAPTAIDDEEDEQEDQKMIIKEAFAGDDVISDFLKEKRKHVDEGKPKVVDLTLPGWGEWGGTGLKASNRKRKRFRIKPQPPPPRQDGKLPNVIISEKRDSSMALHQVSQLPFPFENPNHFEQSIITPVGHTWNTPHTVLKLTAPRVVTRLGSIIEPLSQDAFVQRKKTEGNPAKIPDILLAGESAMQPKRHEGKKASWKKKKQNIAAK